jgi:hypothetical protein
MFNTIKNWFSKDQTEFEARMKKIESQVDVQQAALQVAEAELVIFRAKAAADAERYTSIEPWIEIKSDRIDPIRGLIIEMDWNDAFIQHLKENGITHKDENVVVQKYIAMLYEDVVNKMDQQIIDNSDKKPKVSDFA